MSRRSFLAGAAGLLLAQPTAMHGPILSPDKPWEGSCAMPFSGGIWMVAGGYRCYYLANFNRVCVAYSDDGVGWIKPNLGIIGDTNILLEIAEMDSFSVVPHEGRWYMTVSQRSGGPLQLFTSRNGLWWHRDAVMPWAGDRTTLWFNPIRGRWTFNVRNGGGTGGDPRRIDRVESETFIPKAWEPQPWLSATLEDAGGDEGALSAGLAQLYAVDVVPDSDRLIGLFTIFRGQEIGRPKLNDVCVGFSADGDTWQRAYTPILTRGEIGSWNFGNVQSVGGGVHKVNTGYRVYASGRAGNGFGGNGVCSLGYREVSL